MCQNFKIVILQFSFTISCYNIVNTKKAPLISDSWSLYIKKKHNKIKYNFLQWKIKGILSVGIWAEWEKAALKEKLIQGCL